MLKINLNYTDVYVTRDGQTVAVTSGDKITQEEFATMISESNVMCFDEDTGKQYTYTSGEHVQAAAAGVPDTVVIPAQNAPATDAGRLPADLSAGSENAKA